MTKPAITHGCYVDCRFMPGLKSARISIDIPIENSNEFLKMFGAPDRANPVHVAIARLMPPTPAKPEPVSDPAQATSGAVERKWTRSQKAALKCQDEDFQVWLAEKHPKIWDRHYIDGGYLSLGAANLTLKEVLGIGSKRDLDTDGHKAAAFDALMVDFELRNTVR